MNRVGIVSYSFQYSIGLFTYQDSPGEKLDAAKFVEKTREAGGEVAQVFHSMVDSLSEDELSRVRRAGEEHDVMIEVHGGGAQRPTFEDTMRRAKAMGVKVVGCSFGMMMRPDKIATLEAWDQHLAECKARYAELLPVAAELDVKLGIENHLDFTIEELRDLVKEADSPHAGVIFDVGNPFGTLDDPIEAADLLGPYTVATHYKDFAVEEVARGFRLTMVPLGCGSLQLPEITRRLVKHVSPDIGFAIEMMNGQQLEIPWLEDRFWTPFRGKPARELAATLRHVRGKAIDIDEFFPVTEVDKLPHEEHMQLEVDRITRCVAYLRDLVREASGC